MTGTAHVDIDIILPVHNEARVLESSLTKVLEALTRQVSLRWRVVIVDNGSTDATWAIAQRLAASQPMVRAVHIDGKGRGLALRHAWTHADAPLALYMDIDLSTDLAAVPIILETLREGADIVVGSRYHPQSRARRTLHRLILSRCYNVLERWVLRTRSFNDAQCGFKAVRLASVRPLLPLIRNDNWFFDTELLTLAEYRGLDVRSIPVAWIEDPDTRVRIASSIVEHLWGLLRLRWTIGRHRRTGHRAEPDYSRQGRPSA